MDTSKDEMMVTVTVELRASGKWNQSSKEIVKEPRKAVEKVELKEVLKDEKMENSILVQMDASMEQATDWECLIHALTVWMTG